MLCCHEKKAASPVKAVVKDPVDEELKRKQSKYEELGKKATEAFKAGKFDESVELFTAAMDVGATLSNVAKQQQVLLANR